MAERSKTDTQQLERRNTELSAALEQLQASEERWRTIVSTDPECVKTVSPDGYLIEMNPAGLAMLSATTLNQVQATGRCSNGSRRNTGISFATCISA